MLTAQDLKNCRYVVVGAGLFGSVIAERIANDMGEKVIVIEKRNVTGGNCCSEQDPFTGIEYHTYGSHIFHTYYPEVWEYMNRFCSFNGYRHRVLTRYRDTVYEMPINLNTINRFYGRDYSPTQARLFISCEIARETIETPSNLEEKAISLIGRALYEALVKGYTQKQWGTVPRLLPPSIITRLPVRYNFKSDYFDDPWQGIPLNGYHALFARMLGSKNITLFLNTDYFEIRDLLPPTTRLIYTGPIDRFFDYRFGKLGWRSLRFEKEVHPVADYQGTAVMNYAEESVPYTRIHEFRHYHEERNYPDSHTVVMKEFSSDCGTGEDPCYPINTEEDASMLRLYEQESGKKGNVIFGGRLGSYKYINMDQAVRGALQAYGRFIKPHPIPTS